MWIWMGNFISTASLVSLVPGIASCAKYSVWGYSSHYMATSQFLQGQCPSIAPPCGRPPTMLILIPNLSDPVRYLVNTDIICQVNHSMTKYWRTMMSYINMRRSVLLPALVNIGIKKSYSSCIGMFRIETETWCIIIFVQFCAYHICWTATEFFP